MHCFERQRTSPFRKRVKAHQVLGEAVRARTTIPHFVLLLLLVGWRALSAAIAFLRIVSPFMVSFRCVDHRPIRTGDERERLVTASPVTTKSRGPSWGRNNYTESGLVNLPRRDTRALSPAGMFGEKAPPRLAAQKSRPHAHLGPMRCAPAYFFCKWRI